NHDGQAGTVSITDPTGGVALTVGAGNGSSTFDGLIQDAVGGVGSLKKLGSGTFTLTGANTYSDGTIVDGGTLGLAHSSAAGTGAITVLGSTIDYADTVNVANPIDLQNDVTLNVATGGATQSGPIGETGGSFGVTKTGSGTLTLTGNNSYAGGTTINGGIIAVSADANLGATTGALTFDGGDLQFGASFDLDPARAIAINAGGGKIRTNVFVTTISQGITGAGGLVKEGTGTLTLTGGNTYSGGTTVNNGTLQIGNGGTTGSITGDVAVNSGDVLAFNRSNNLTFGGVISGTGNVTKRGAGTLTVTGTNTYSGGTIIEGGTLSISSDGNLGDTSGPVTFEGGTLRTETLWTIFPVSRPFVANGADAVFDIASNGILNGGISGTGGLVVTGSLIVQTTPFTYS
ncbi:hypothetical protein LCGC14_2827170, partial [marine sediment metagenome]